MALRKMRMLKRDWAGFVRDFNRQNQFRRATLLIGDSVLAGEPGMPFAGLSYDPDARNIGIYLGGISADSVAHMVHMVTVPRALYLLQDKDALNPVLGVQIVGGPGTEIVSVLFLDEKTEQTRKDWIDSVAYSLFEKRGMAHGRDRQDWFEAEHLVDEALKTFID